VFIESRVKLGLMFWELATADSGVEEVGAEVGMATTEEIGRAGLIVRVVKGFEVGVWSSGKSWTLKLVKSKIRGFVGLRVGRGSQNREVVCGRVGGWWQTCRKVMVAYLRVGDWFYLLASWFRLGRKKRKQRDRRRLSRGKLSNPLNIFRFLSLSEEERNLWYFLV
jgi:hypothetical protein